VVLRDVTGELYTVRNYIAHGDRLPEDYFQNERRPSLGPQGVNMIEMLLESQSFIIRRSLLKILRENLLEHFAGAQAAQDYFAAHRLTKADVRAGRPALP